MENGGAAGRSGGAPSSWGFWERASWPTSSPSSSSCYSSFSTPPATYFRPSDHPAAAGTNADSWATHHHHLTCLKLGKRQYCDEQQRAEESAAAAAAKRERAVPPPRCQVDGCSKALVAEKEYHKRHKVCEPHSKAPRVLLLGLDQRFCQQCSRFHVISEFDDAKRSCRRRLAGHNERRRKSSADPITRSQPAAFLGHLVQCIDNAEIHSANIRKPKESAISEGMAPYLPVPPGCALSLLSSKASPWIATVADLPSRSSAALNELIAENRAALLARQLFIDQGGHAVLYAKQQQQQVELPYFLWPHQQLQQVIAPQAAALLADGWSSQLPQQSGSHVTLDLMQMPGSFEIVPARAKSKGEEEECGDIWKSLAGTHVI